MIAPPGLTPRATGSSPHAKVTRQSQIARSHEPDAAVFKAYWYFAAERHAMYLRRVEGLPGPWTKDPILGSYRFTNSFRASDRVSQYLIRHVQYDCNRSAEDLVLRTLLFRWFNKPQTWELLTAEIGEPTAASFDPGAACDLLARARSQRMTIYSGAYIVPPVPNTGGPKHEGHLRLTRRLLDDGLAERVQATTTLEDLFHVMKAIPGVGDFLAYQLTIDLNYSTVTNHCEDEYVVPGPGALDGLSKVFPSASRRSAPQLIRQMVDEQDHWFSHFGAYFPGLFGRRLQLIDCQNLFCEISKYTRVAFPHVRGVAGRTRIKQGFSPAGPVPPPVYPPKWNLVTAPSPSPMGGRSRSRGS